MVENKEKAYDEAIERAKKVIKGEADAEPGISICEYIFPELAESEDERIRKEIIDYIKTGTYKKDWLTWLEKQGKNENKINPDKITFTFSDILALECSMKTAKITKGGDELYKILVPLYNKIHNAYLLERQDNVDKAFYENGENNVNEETNAPTEYGKYVDECLNEASKHFFSEGEDKYSVADLFYAGVRCGKSWVEKQGEKKQTWSEDDEHIIKDAVYFLETAKKHYASTIGLDACIDWLKSLKQRYCFFDVPQNKK